MKIWLTRTGLSGFTLSLICALLFHVPVASAQLPIVNRSNTQLDTYDPNGELHGTVVVGIALSDGLVMAGDSRLTQQTFPQARVISDSGTKVFGIGKFGVATYGEAFLEKRTIASWVDDFRAKEQKPLDDIDGFADRFAKFFNAVYLRSYPVGGPQPALGFLMGGYDSAGKGKILFIEFPKTTAPQLSADTHDKPGIQWNGQTDVIQRLVMGYDPTMGALPTFNSLTADQQKSFGAELPRLQYNIAWNALMLQDGIDLATTFIKTTINMQRFANGTLMSPFGIPGVGGSIDILVVTPSGIQWVKKKTLSAD